ncbi:MAG: hypothetical protein QOI98_310 [Solirubrobacteraceae bacterium]|nr:hypothetical protein [Solirubrobacteraceae bacterium]
MRRVVGSVIGLVLLLALGAAGSALAADPEIRVLSNRADLISGGDALVEVVAPAGASAASLSVALNGSDVTSAFGVRADGRFTGLLTNLQPGDNIVTARIGGGDPVSLTILNHPIGGPVLAGPQIQPWTCFAGALDKQCNRPVTYAFSYKPTSGAPLQAYDPENPPSDVAMTTTDQGKTVPFIVRQETGTIDRDEYRIAVLFDPKKPWSPVAPQDGFNHKLVIFHGASCDTAYTQAAANDVLNETALGAGFATMSHALDNAGHNCNIVTQAESLIMTKEHLIDTYGTVRYTIGSGCSGGSLVQQQVANAYPGLYQGITPQCSFTDAWSSAMQYEDYVMIRRYLENPGGWAPGVVWLPNQVQAIEGHINPVNAVTFTEVIPNSGNPTRSCPGLSMDQVYDQQTNPHGVRCSLQDYMVNVFGRRAKDGFAQRPFDNVGIQYGLKALIAGTISPAQFLDLNAKIGSVDIDFNPTTARTEADRPALERVYRSGAVDQADNLDKVAIIDLRGPDPGAFHDVYRTYVMRARLDRNFHTHANQVLWRGLVPLMGDANYADEAILAVDKWLAAVEKDPRDLPLAQKIIADKPESVTDRCTNGGGVALPESVCDGLVTPYSDPRLESGMPMTDDTVKCELKPLLRADYGSVTFTDAQWVEMGKAFPNGVCDYTKPGVDRVATTPWQTYQDNDGSVVYGGRALGPAPVAAPLAPLSLTASTTCVSGRRLRLRLRVATGLPLRSARVYVNGRSRMVLKGRALTRTLSLRGLPGGAVRLKVVATTRAGKRLTARQVFRACAAKSRKR